MTCAGARARGNVVQLLDLISGLSVCSLQILCALTGSRIVLHESCMIDKLLCSTLFFTRMHGAPFIKSCGFR